MPSKSPVYIPFENPRSKDGQYTAVLSVDRILFNRRNKLGLKQQEVADMAGIPMRQYQRFESGESSLSKTNAEIAFAVCTVLLLDPYELIKYKATAADPATLQPQHCFDIRGHEYDYPQHLGRKPLQRDIMTVCLNFAASSVIVPRKVLEFLGKPSSISMKPVLDERRLLICQADKDDTDSFSISENLYEKEESLVYPAMDLFIDLTRYRRWNASVYAVECRLVENREGIRLILCDLNTAQPRYAAV